MIISTNPITPFLKEMRKELNLALPDFRQWLHTLSTTDDDTALMEAVECYGGQVERTGLTADMLGIAGLNHWCIHLNANLMAIAMLDAGTRAKACTHLAIWPPLVDAYLAAPADFDASLALADYLTSPHSAQPIDEMASIALAEQLATPPVLPEELVADFEAASQLAEVTAADVSLVLPEEADPDVYRAFIDEAPNNLVQFAAFTAHIANGSASIEDIRHAKRIAHSFKGSANIVGIRGIAAIGHHTEDVLDYFEQSLVKPPRALGLALVDASDCLSQMVAYLQGEEEAPAQSFQVLSTIVAWANKVKTGEIDNTVEVTPEASRAPEYAQAAIQTLALTPPPSTATPRSEAVKKATSLDMTEASLRVPVKTVDELFRLVGELTNKLGQLENRVKTANARARGLQTQNLAVQQRVLDLEKMVLLRGHSLNIARADSTDNGSDTTFDPLELDRYNELHGATRALVEVTADARELANAIEADVADIAQNLGQQNQLNKDLRHQVISTRMTSVGALIPRLTRNVRQTCQQTGKNAELVITGGNILVDGDVLNKLADPLLHLLRNAVDHGIEMPEVRAGTGKPANGTINLAFSRQGSSVTVRIADDGHGLDYQRIQTQAVVRGLITEEQELSHAELARLTLLPGFSTRDRVSEISGRGVGMDVVATRLAELKGSVELTSETGHGCEITLRFQASLVTQHTLMVESARQLFAIPIHNIEQAVAAGIGKVHGVDKEWRLTLGDTQYPVHDLAPLTGYASPILTQALLETLPMVIIRTDIGNVAVVVDKVIDSRDQIIKGMGRYLQRVHGVSGATLLGDGTVVPLLNIPELLAEPLVVSTAAAQLAAAARQQVRRILVVDDSLSVRKSLMQLLQDAAFEVESAGDGLEAIRALDQFKPDVICTDLEMPNMNGLELTSHLRRRADTHTLPIIMITSRSMDKHRDQAKQAGVDFYVTKPYTDADLLAQVSQALMIAHPITNH